MCFQIINGITPSLDLARRLPHKGAMSNIQSRPSWLRFAVDYGPIAAFFIAYSMADLFVATASIMVVTVVALGLSYVVERRIPKMPLITAAIIGVFGGLTLWLQDETFIKMKPTIIHCIFGAVLSGGLFANRYFLKSILGAVWQMTEQGWWVLTLRYAAFSFFLAALNEAVWRTQSTDVWVSFKVFGLIGLTFAFIIIQMPLLKKFTPTGDDG